MVLRARSVDTSRVDVSAEELRAGFVEPHALRAEGYRTLRVREPVPLGAEPGADAKVVRTLAEAASATIAVRWNYSGSLPCAAGVLAHLPPPGSGSDVVDVARWRGEHGYGRCSYRLGPGFVVLNDGRPSVEDLRVTIDGAGAAVFLALVRVRGPIAVRRLDGDGAALLAELRHLDLAVDVSEEECVLLPYRVRTWPISYAEAQP